MFSQCVLQEPPCHLEPVSFLFGGSIWWVTHVCVREVINDFDKYTSFMLGITVHPQVHSHIYLLPTCVSCDSREYIEINLSVSVVDPLPPQYKLE